MIQMAIVNLTPDSFYEPSRVWTDCTDTGRQADAAMKRIRQFMDAGADIIDLGAVSTRPGAADVPVEEEWRRLKPVLTALAAEKLEGGSLPGVTRPQPAGVCRDSGISEDGRSQGDLPPKRSATSDRYQISIDTTSAVIVRRAYEVIGDFIVNDISAGEDDPEMLQTVADLGLTYIAMHKRGNPRSMDSLCDYPDGIMAELLRYFEAFAAKAEAIGIHDWILDPGLGFAKTEAQNWEILENLEQLKVFGRPILIGAADKRFTHGNTAAAHELAIAHGADILRVHNLV